MAGQMSVKELKAALDALSISYHGIFEKSELVGLLEGAWNPKPVGEEAPEEKLFDLPVNNLAGDVVATMEVCGSTWLSEVQWKLAPNVEASPEEILRGVSMCLGDGILDLTKTIKEANVKQGDVLTVVFSGTLKEIMLARRNGPYILRQGKIKTREADKAMTVLRFPQGIAYQRPVQKYHVTCSHHDHGEIVSVDSVMQFSEGVVSSDITDMDRTCDVVWKKSVAYSKSTGYRKSTCPASMWGPQPVSVAYDTEKPWAAESVTPVNENFRLRDFSREDEDFWKNDGPALEAFKQLESIPDDGTA